jgi:hypothetical protein
MAEVPHPHAESRSTGFPHSTLLSKHAPQASASQGLPFASSGSEFTTHYEGRDGFSSGNMVALYQTVRGEGESTGQHSNDSNFQCLHDAIASDFRALVQLNEEIETSTEELASVGLDAVPRQTSVPASFESCLARLGQDPSSFGEAISSAEHDWSTGGQFVDHDLYPIQTGLLGESGEAIRAAHEAMKEIEAVHSSDELMHFEFCGPFWELSEV